MQPQEPARTMRRAEGISCGTEVTCELSMLIHGMVVGELGSRLHGPIGEMSLVISLCQVVALQRFLLLPDKFAVKLCLLHRCRRKTAE